MPNVWITLCVQYESNTEIICWCNCKGNLFLFRLMASQYFTDQGTWTIYKYGTIQRKPMLFDSAGHAYTYHNSNKQRPFWRCIYRVTLSCNAAVKQFGSSFVFGKKPHHHDPDNKVMSLCHFRHTIVEKDIEYPFIPATQVLNEVLSERRRLNLSIPTRVKVHDLCHNLRRYRKKHRAHSSDVLNFISQEIYIPHDFVLVDLQVHGHHLILGTQQMVDILHECKHWYIDCHEYFVEEPATFVTFSAFLKKENLIVHEPLLYCILSNSNKKAYRVVLKCILKLLKNGYTSLTDITLGFEEALWRVLPRVLPGVSLHACGYAFRQQLWKTAGEINCASPSHLTLKILLALPFLPVEDIVKQVNVLSAKNLRQNERHLMDCLSAIGVDSFISHSQLSVYHQSIRMKAEAEGWFSTLHGKEGATYGSIASLVHMLYERSVVDDSYVPVSDRKVMKFQRKNADSVTSELWRAWKLREQHHMNAEQLLDHCVSVLPLPYLVWYILYI